MGGLAISWQPSLMGEQGAAAVEAERFDQIVHGLAQASTRRLALAGLLGALTGALALSDPEPAGARRKKRKRKKKGQDGNAPPPVSPPPASPPPPTSPPPPPIVCQGSTKVCGTACIPLAECCGGCGQAETCCKGTCRNLATDGQNCGICGNICDTNLCVNGACDCLGAQANCAAACACSARRNNAGTVCAFGTTNAGCGNDDDCDLGSVCLVTNTCSIPCFP